MAQEAAPDKYNVRKRKGESFKLPESTGVNYMDFFEDISEEESSNEERSLKDIALKRAKVANPAPKAETANQITTAATPLVGKIESDFPQSTFKPPLKSILKKTFQIFKIQAPKSNAAVIQSGYSQSFKTEATEKVIPFFPMSKPIAPISPSQKAYSPLTKDLSSPVVSSPTSGLPLKHSPTTRIEATVTKIQEVTQVPMDTRLDKDQNKIATSVQEKMDNPIESSNPASPSLHHLGSELTFNNAQLSQLYKNSLPQILSLANPANTPLLSPSLPLEATKLRLQKAKEMTLTKAKALKREQEVLEKEQQAIEAQEKALIRRETKIKAIKAILLKAQEEKEAFKAAQAQALKEFVA